MSGVFQMKLFLAIVLFFMLGCATPQIQPEPKIITEYKYIQKENPNLPLPKPLSLDTVEWLVITPDNIDTIWQEQQDKGELLVLFAVTPKTYKVFSGNIEQIMNYIILLKEHDQSINNYYLRE